MDVQIALCPTGLRKITIPQLQAEAAGAVPFTPASPGRILAAFKRAAPALGVSRRVVDFVDYLMSHNRPQDWEGGPGPIVWPSDMELEDRLGVGRSQCKALVRATLDAGLVRLHRSPTGRRWGYRKGSGYEARIVEAYGFDMTPLGERRRSSSTWRRSGRHAAPKESGCGARSPARATASCPWWTWRCRRTWPARTGPRRRPKPMRCGVSGAPSATRCRWCPSRPGCGRCPSIRRSGRRRRWRLWKPGKSTPRGRKTGPTLQLQMN